MRSSTHRTQQPRLVLRQPARAALAPRVEPVLPRLASYGRIALRAPPTPLSLAAAPLRSCWPTRAKSSFRGPWPSPASKPFGPWKRGNSRAAGGGGGDVAGGGGSAAAGACSPAHSRARGTRPRDRQSRRRRRRRRRRRWPWRPRGVGVGEGGALLRQRVPERRAARDVDAHAAVAARGAAVGVRSSALDGPSRSAHSAGRGRPKWARVASHSRSFAEGGGASTPTVRQSAIESSASSRRSASLANAPSAAAAGLPGPRRPQRRAQPQQALARRAAHLGGAGGDRTPRGAGVGVVRRRRVGAVRRLVQQQPEQARRARRTPPTPPGRRASSRRRRRAASTARRRPPPARQPSACASASAAAHASSPGCPGTAPSQGGRAAGPAARHLQRAQRADRRRRADGRGAEQPMRSCALENCGWPGELCVAVDSLRRARARVKDSL